MNVFKPASVSLFVLLAVCATPVNALDNSTSSNPLMQQSTLPYQLPPFDRITDADFGPALQAGMAGQRKEIDAIAHDSAAATFENTIVAMERSGQLLTRASSVFFNLTSSNTNPELEKLQAEMAPKLSAHSDAIFLNPELFARVSSLYEQRNSLKLDAESHRLLERYNTLFVRAGAKLSEADKMRLRQMNEQLSTLTTQFSQTVLKGVNAGAVVFDKVIDLDGLTSEQIAVAAEAAKARKLEGKWVIALLNTTGQPSLSQLKNRATRERIYKSVDRARLGWRVRYYRPDRPNRETARRSRSAAGLSESRRLCTRR